MTTVYRLLSAVIQGETKSEVEDTLTTVLRLLKQENGIVQFQGEIAETDKGWVVNIDYAKPTRFL